MYKKYITNKISYNKIRKNNPTSTNPPPLLPLPTSKKKIIITQTHTLSYSNQNHITKLLCMYIYIYKLAQIVQNNIFYSIGPTIHVGLTLETDQWKYM